MKLLLYGTEHCSLCERALDLLFSMPELRAATLEVVDVAAAPDDAERYGARLPVLKVGAVEVDWPFDRAAVVRAIAAARVPDR